jgi:DNA invertase Pin-like site-specific DNA recombinase
VQHLENCGVDLFIDQQSIDTTTPTGKLMFQMVGAFAEFERSKSDRVAGCVENNWDRRL